MTRFWFHAVSGTAVPAVTAAEMKDVDRIAVEDIGLSILQMMEHAGRNLARRVLARHRIGPVAVLAGAGGNGGGGLACARHLANRDVPVTVVLDRPRTAFDGPAGSQLRLLDSMDVAVVDEATQWEPTPAIIVDALVGYGLEGSPRAPIAELIRRANDAGSPIVALDVPTGLDATTGVQPGEAIRPAETVTLALPKTGLRDIGGDVYLGDLGIPQVVFELAGMAHQSPYRDRFLVEIVPDDADE